jgi:hypothetical protein
MKNIFAGLIIASALVATSQASALNACKQVDVEVINNHASGNAIKVKYIKYKVGNTWYKEDVSDKVPTAGNRASWSNQNLQNLPEGSGTTFRVYFQEQTKGGAVPQYSSTRYIEYVRNDACNDGRDYTFNINQAGTVGS